MEGQNLSKSWLYVLIIILAGYFIIRLFNQAKLIWTFPFDYANDYSSHLAELFFLKSCGFHNLCEYWYNGFILFKSYVPGWFFFTFPLYEVLGDVKVATYVSLILMFVLCLVGLYLIGRKFNFSIYEVLTWFLILFVNPISIGNFVRLGRVTELFGWVIFFFMAYLIFHYRNKEIDWKFFFSFTPLYALLLISHLNVMVMAQFFVLSLFLVRFHLKDWVMILSSIICGFLLASFWVIPYIIDLASNTTLDYALGWWLLDFSSAHLLANIASILVSLFLVFAFLFYWKQTKFDRKELLFYSPILVFNFLVLFRLSPFLPVIKHLYPDPLMFFFLIFAVFFFLRIKLKTYFGFIRKSLPYVLIGIAILFVIVSAMYTPWFVDHSESDEEVLSLLEEVDGIFLMGPSLYGSFSRAFYSYAPIYNHLSTAEGWVQMYVTDEYLGMLDLVDEGFKGDRCEDVVEGLEYLNVTNVIGYDYYCDFMLECGLEEVETLEYTCLYKFNP